MLITIHIPLMLRQYADGAKEIRISATTVRTALDHIEQSHPSLIRSVCDDTGAVRRHVNVFVNNDNIRDREGLDTALVKGDVITILPAVSGG